MSPTNRVLQVPKRRSLTELSPSGECLVSAQDSCLQLAHLDAGSQASQFMSAHKITQVQACVFSPSGALLVVIHRSKPHRLSLDSSSKLLVQVYHTRTQAWREQPLKQAEHPLFEDVPVSHLSVSPDETFAAATWTPTDAPSGVHVFRLVQPGQAFVVVFGQHACLGLHWMQGRMLAVSTPAGVSFQECTSLPLPPAAHVPWSALGIRFAPIVASDSSPSGHLLALAVQPADSGDRSFPVRVQVSLLAAGSRRVSSTISRAWYVDRWRPGFQPSVCLRLGETAVAVAVGSSERYWISQCTRVFAVSGARRELWARDKFEPAAWHGTLLAGHLIMPTYYGFAGQLDQTHVVILDGLSGAVLSSHWLAKLEPHPSSMALATRALWTGSLQWVVGRHAELQYRSAAASAGRDGVHCWMRVAFH